MSSDSNTNKASILKSILSQTQMQVGSLLCWINQKELEIELEQFPSHTTNLCEIYEINAKKPLLYVFSANKYIQEVEEHRFKQLLSVSAKTIKLMQAIKKAREKHNKLKLSISQIIEQLDTHSNQEKHNYISHLLSLAYYLDWDIEKESNDIETLSYILAPHSFLNPLKERFNLSNVCSIYEDEKIAMYVNSNYEVIAFFKTQEEFSREDIKKIIIPALKETFSFNRVELKDK